MSRDELSEIEQLDALAAELASAGRLARAASARGERPDATFAMSLRARLLRDLPMSPASLEAAEGSEARRAGVVAAPKPDGAELETLAAMPDWPDVDRRNGRRRPFGDAVEMAPAAVIAESDERSELSTHRVIALRPSVRSGLPTLARPRRWLALTAAAAVILALVAGNGNFWPQRSEATATDATLATLVRSGSSSALSSGTELHEGDEIKVGAGGHATAQIGASYVRLSGGADIRLERLEIAHVVVDQLAGRVYHRVVTATSGAEYDVVTASVTWKALGTAFDLDRHGVAGGEEVRALALEHAVAMRGPAIDRSVSQGEMATVELSDDGRPTATPILVGSIDLVSLNDPWLVGNASLDAALGLPLGELAAVVKPEPTPLPTPMPTQTPTVAPLSTQEPTAEPTPEPTPSQSPTATPRPTVRPTVRPTAPPTAVPTAKPSVGTLSVASNGGGKYTFTWSRYAGAGLLYYKVAYEPYPGTPDYTKGSNYACAIANAAVTTCVWNPAPGKWNVRVQAIGNGNVILSQSNIVTINVAAPATLPPTVDLGSMTVTKNGDGTVTFGWSPYTGSATWDYYKLVFEDTASGVVPSYPNGSSYWAVPATTDTSVTVDLSGYTPGDWQVRIQAIGYPNGAYAYAQSTVYHLILP